MRPDPNNPPKDEAELAELLFAPSTTTQRLAQEFPAPREGVTDEEARAFFGMPTDDED